MVLYRQLDTDGTTDSAYYHGISAPAEHRRYFLAAYLRAMYIVPFISDGGQGSHCDGNWAHSCDNAK